MHRYAVIDAPTMLGVGPKGVQELPTALKAAGLMRELEASYTGRVPVPPYNPLRDIKTGLLNPEGVHVFARRLADKVTEVLDAGQFPIVLGGDCSLEIGTALALRRRGHYGLLFLDGHADFYQPEAELYGEVSSMELALITGRGPELLTDIDGLRPLLRDEDIAVFGIRDDYNAAEEGSQDIRTSRMHIYGIADIRKRSIHEMATAALTVIERNDLQGFWIHLDADVLSNIIMPAVDYQLSDEGLNFQELSEILRITRLGAVGLSITIFNPLLDTDGSIAQAFTQSLINGLKA